jgi:hypothetical protein
VPGLAQLADDVPADEAARTRDVDPHALFGEHPKALATGRDCQAVVERHQA